MSICYEKNMNNDIYKILESKFASIKEYNNDCWQIVCEKKEFMLNNVLVIDKSFIAGLKSNFSPVLNDSIHVIATTRDYTVFTELNSIFDRVKNLVQKKVIIKELAHFNEKDGKCAYLQYSFEGLRLIGSEFCDLHKLVFTSHGKVELRSIQFNQYQQKEGTAVFNIRV